MYELITIFQDYTDNMGVFISLAVGCFVATAIFVFLLSPIHNFIQARLALGFGDENIKKRGYLTLNPFKSFNWFGALSALLLKIGYTSHVGYKRSRFYHPTVGTLVIAFSGPVFYFLCYLVVYTIFYSLLQSGFFGVDSVRMAFEDANVITYVYHSFIVTLQFLGRICFFSALCNLIPMFPFDMGDVLMLFLRPSWLKAIGNNELLISLGFLLLFFFTIGAPGGFLDSLYSDVGTPIRLIVELFT